MKGVMMRLAKSLKSNDVAHGKLARLVGKGLQAHERKESIDRREDHKVQAVRQYVGKGRAVLRRRHGRVDRGRRRNELRSLQADGCWGWGGRILPTLGPGFHSNCGGWGVEGFLHLHFPRWIRASALV